MRLLNNLFVRFTVDLCDMFLSRSWYAFDGTAECGAQYNILLDELLKGLFKKSDLAKIDNYLRWTQIEAKQLKQKSSTLKTFPCFTKYMQFLTNSESIPTCDIIT